MRLVLDSPETPGQTRGYTVGLKSDGTVAAAGLEVELAKWDLN